VQAIHTALIVPSAIASNISTRSCPASKEHRRLPTTSPLPRGALHCRGRDAPDSRFAIPPTSRPPIAFGWPVS
jgi:hypothetical protein